MTPEEARALGRTDANRLIEIAREFPRLVGTVDPEEHWHKLPRPGEYVDSPDLPARRVASEWSDHSPATRALEPDWRELSKQAPGDPDAMPHVVARLGDNSRKVFEEGDDDAWTAYTDALQQTAKEADVIVVETTHEYWPEPQIDRFYEVRSLYVADLRRYELRPVKGNPDQGTIWESEIFKAFTPRYPPKRNWLDRLTRRWRKKPPNW